MKIHLLFISLLLTVTSFSQTKDCKRFRNGTFKMEIEGTTTIIERTGTSQLEYFNHSKVPTSYSVEWTDDCTYTLKPKEDTFKKYPNLPKDAVVTVRITKTTDSSYTQTTTSNFHDMIVTVDVVKIK